MHKNQNRDKSGRNGTKLTSNPTNKYLTQQTNQYQYINVKKMSIKSTLVAVRKKFTSRISKTEVGYDIDSATFNNLQSDRATCNPEGMNRLV